MLYTVVKFDYSDNVICRKTYFRSNDLRDCWNFVRDRLTSVVDSAAVEAFDFVVIDSLGEFATMPLDIVALRKNLFSFGRKVA